jgi:hypothetical protein
MLLLRPKIFAQKFNIPDAFVGAIRLHTVSIKSVVKQTTHIRGQTRLSIQLSFELCDKVGDCPMKKNIQVIPLDIGSLKGSPLSHLDQNVFVFFNKTRANTFRRRVRQIS